MLYFYHLLTTSNIKDSSNSKDSNNINHRTSYFNEESFSNNNNNKKSNKKKNNNNNNKSQSKLSKPKTTTNNINDNTADGTNDNDNDNSNFNQNESFLSLLSITGTLYKLLILTLSIVKISCILFYTSKLINIIYAYFLISIFILMVPIIYGLFNWSHFPSKKPQNSKKSGLLASEIWVILNPYTHLYIDTLVFTMYHISIGISRIVTSFSFSKKINSNSSSNSNNYNNSTNNSNKKASNSKRYENIIFLSSLVITIFSVVIYRLYQALYNDNSKLILIQNTTFFISIFGSYGIALLLHIAFICIFQIIGILIYYMQMSLYTIIRVICKRLFNISIRRHIYKPYLLFINNIYNMKTSLFSIFKSATTSNNTNAIPTDTTNMTGEQIIHMRKKQKAALLNNNNKLNIFDFFLKYILQCIVEYFSLLLLITVVVISSWYRITGYSLFFTGLETSNNNANNNNDDNIMDKGNYILTASCVIGGLYFIIQYLYLLCNHYYLYNTITNNSSINNREKEENVQYFNNPLYAHITLLLVYTPALCLCLPTLFYSITILFPGYTTSLYLWHNLSDIYNIFNPERVHYCLSVYIIAWHIRYVNTLNNNSTNNNDNSELLSKDKPIDINRSIIETRNIENRKIKPVKLFITVNQYYKKILFFISTGDYNFDGNLDDFYGFTDGITGNTTCVHEDGGKYAIFEKVDSYLNNHQNNDVVIGSTYKVVSCACYKDKNLKFVSEYCDWCRCQKCGGNQIHNKNNDNSFTSSSGNNNNTNKSNEELVAEYLQMFNFTIDDINSDIIVVFILFIIIIITHFYLKDYNYYLYASALISGIYLIRNYIVHIVDKICRQFSF